MVEIPREHRRFEDFWKTLWRRKWIVALTVAAAIASVFAGNFLATPLYEAFATLHLKEQMPSVLGRDYPSGAISDLTPAEVYGEPDAASALGAAETLLEWIKTVVRAQ